MFCLLVRLRAHNALRPVSDASVKSLISSFDKVGIYRALKSTALCVTIQDVCTTADLQKLTKPGKIGSMQINVYTGKKATYFCGSNRVAALLEYTMGMGNPELWAAFVYSDSLQIQHFKFVTF